VEMTAGMAGRRLSRGKIAQHGKGVESEEGPAEEHHQLSRVDNEGGYQDGAIDGRSAHRAANDQHQR